MYGTEYVSLVHIDTVYGVGSVAAYLYRTVHAHSANDEAMVCPVCRVADARGAMFIGKIDCTAVEEGTDCHADPSCCAGVLSTSLEVGAFDDFVLSDKHVDYVGEVGGLPA